MQSILNKCCSASWFSVDLRLSDKERVGKAAIIETIQMVEFSERDTFILYLITFEIRCALSMASNII